MEPFAISLPDGRTTTGLVFLPPQPSTTPKGTPLLVTVHGGTYTADYYNADPSHSIQNASLALGVPVVSLTRPGYAKSSTLPPLDKGDTFCQQQGRFIHELVLPAVWKEYGIKSGATTIVLHAHSIGASIAIITTALHNRNPQTAGYPLGGLVTSGIGARLYEEPSDNAHADDEKASTLREIDSHTEGDEVPTLTWPVEARDQLMLRPQWGLSSPEVLKQSERLNNPSSLLEAFDIRSQWPKYRREFCKDVTVPHMYSVGQFDNFWVNTKEAVDEYASWFPASERVEASVLPMAPHCIELSYQGQAWLSRTLAFAMECAVADELKKSSTAPR